MPRNIRSTQLETRSARANLPVAKKPIFIRAGPTIGLGYRKNQIGGTWVVRVADGRGGSWTKAIGRADDLDNADGNVVLDFWQAQEKARAVGRGDNGVDSSRPATVGDALDAYEADLKTRGADVGNAVRIRAHLPLGLRDKAVVLLTARDLRRWRDGLVERMAASSANRTSASLKAALNLAADNDERITNIRAWITGLAKIPGATNPRNVILDEGTVLLIIAEAYRLGPEFGLLVELAAATGARVSQIARLEVQDIQPDRADPRLLMPTSRKGRRGVKVIRRHPVPISVGLAARLGYLTKGRPPASIFLLKRNGQPWKKSQYREPFRRAVTAAKRDPTEVTMYALRHSNIVRQLLAGVPIRVVAVNHDTSVTEIERTYSRYIGDHSDALARAALLDTTMAVRSNIVPIRATVAIE